MNKILLLTLLSSLILTITANAQTEEVFYYPKLPKVELSVAKTNLERALKEMYYPNNEKNYWYKPESASVFDDRFVLTFKSPMNPIVFYFYDLKNYRIEVIKISKDNNHFDFELRLGKLIISVYKEKEHDWELIDYLYFFQQVTQKPYSDQLVLFEPIAAHYRGLELKPAMSEEQRKYIVQANLLNQQKMYGKAIEHYNKALEMDPTAYPPAWSNLALLSSQIHDYHAAIYYMKKYLMLEPEATDARSCQDKIYEWEIMMQE
ncbi:MAG: tetratricopeptide repeat protein [Bacteroidales bacterium]|nr:tetratricopeptide repeat protein [Bacteroidales bacterium]